MAEPRNLAAVPEHHPQLSSLPPDMARRSYAAVREAWQGSLAVCDATYEPLAVALRAFAREARTRGLPAATVLTALDALIRPSAGGNAALDWDHVRQWAGTVAIRAYYQDD